MPYLTSPRLLNSARWRNLRIGLLGGSFNPPHLGHKHISLAALKGLDLDIVWWLVTPQNPLKSDQPENLDQRLEKCRSVSHHPNIIVSDLEAQMGTHITYFSIKKLLERYGQHKFVWISGMDNALSLHHWNHWRDLLRLIPMVHITRKPVATLIKNCPLRMQDTQNHIFLDRPDRPNCFRGVHFGCCRINGEYFIHRNS